MPRRPLNVEIEGFGPVRPHGVHMERVSPTKAVPNHFTVSVLLAEPRVNVDLEIRVVTGGQPQVIQVSVREMPPLVGGVTSTTLRSLPLDHIVRATMTWVAEQSPDLIEGSIPGWFRLEADGPDVLRRGSVDERVAQAAQIYRAATAAGSKAPTEAVATSMHVSRATASRYIRGARDIGMLPPEAAK